MQRVKRGYVLHVIIYAYISNTIVQVSISIHISFHTTLIICIKFHMNLRIPGIFNIIHNRMNIDKEKNIVFPSTEPKRFGITYYLMDD